MKANNMALLVLSFCTFGVSISAHAMPYAYYDVSGFVQGLSGISVNGTMSIASKTTAQPGGDAIYASYPIKTFAFYVKGVGSFISSDSAGRIEIEKDPPGPVSDATSLFLHPYLVGSATYGPYRFAQGGGYFFHSDGTPYDRKPQNEDWLSAPPILELRLDGLGLGFFILRLTKGVPEPSSFLLVMIGLLAGMAFIQKRIT